jgi:hypothetical protein
MERKAGMGGGSGPCWRRYTTLLWGRAAVVHGCGGCSLLPRAVAPLLGDVLDLVPRYDPAVGQPGTSSSSSNNLSWSLRAAGSHVVAQLFAWKTEPVIVTVFRRR